MIIAILAKKRKNKLHSKNTIASDYSLRALMSNSNIILFIGNPLLVMPMRKQMGISHCIVTVDPEVYLFTYSIKFHKGTGIFQCSPGS